MRTARNQVKDMSKAEIVEAFMQIKNKQGNYSRKMRDLITQRAIRIDNKADNNVDVLRHGVAEYMQNRAENDEKICIVVSQEVFVDIFNLSDVEGSGAEARPDGLYVDGIMLLTFNEMAKFINIPEGLKPSQFFITELMDEYLPKPADDDNVKVIGMKPDM